MKKLVALAATSLCLAGASSALAPAMADSPRGNTTTNINQTMWHVGLNPGNCGPGDADPGSTKNGQAVIHVNTKQGTTVLDVSVSSAVADSFYVVDIRCVGAIGGFTTDSSGNGSTEISLSSMPQTPFVIDASIPGGGAFGGYGDTFVSSQFGG